LYVLPIRSWGIYCCFNMIMVAVTSIVSSIIVYISSNHQDKPVPLWARKVCKLLIITCITYYQLSLNPSLFHVPDSLPTRRVFGLKTRISCTSSSTGLMETLWCELRFSTNSLRRCCHQPTAQCNKSRGPEDLLKKLRSVKFRPALQSLANWYYRLVYAELLNST